MKVYAVYSIPKSPEYRLEKLFKTKEAAKEYVRKEKNIAVRICLNCGETIYKIDQENKTACCYERNFSYPFFKEKIYDIQIEEIEE